MHYPLIKFVMAHLRESEDLEPRTSLSCDIFNLNLYEIQPFRLELLRYTNTLPKP